jgi:hypothetical protein
MLVLLTGRSARGLSDVFSRCFTCPVMFVSTGVCDGAVVFSVPKQPDTVTYIYIAHSIIAK